jgi:hypothetical protein
VLSIKNLWCTIKRLNEYKNEMLRRTGGEGNGEGRRGRRRRRRRRRNEPSLG